MRGPNLIEIAEKHGVDIKILEKTAQKLSIKLKDGKNTTIQKYEEVKLLEAAGISEKTIIIKDKIEKKEKSIVQPIFLDDLIPKSIPVYRNNLKYEIFLHNDVLGNLTSEKDLNDSVKKRLNLVLRQLVSHGKPSSIIKGTGKQGWRRTPLGGKFKYYLWWAPKGATPVEELGGIDGSIYIRQIREHDNFKPLKCGILDEHYTQLSIECLAEEKEIFLEPWTDNQKEFCRNKKAVRVLNGSPGSGKTTALWNAVDARINEKVLYITRSLPLVSVAKEHFGTFSPINTDVTCIAFSELINQILSINRNYQSSFVDKSFELFKKTVSEIPDNILGKWKNQTYSLWSIIRAFLIGPALPVKPRDLEQNRPRLNNDKFRKNKIPGIGAVDKETILEIVKFLEKGGPVERFFEDLNYAFRAAKSLMENNSTPENFEGINRIVLDEVQDLTPIEILIPIFLVIQIAKNNKQKTPFLLLAGDPSQTVIPTGFRWGTINALLSKYLQQPKETKLITNVRSPSNIAYLINKASNLYSDFLKKESRPKGAILNPESNESTNDLICYCKIENIGDIKNLLISLAEEPDLAVISLENNPPSYIPDSLLDVIQTPEKVKGRDIQKVCILDASKYLREVKKEYEFYEDEKEDLIWKRTLIDRFRVAL